MSDMNVNASFECFSEGTKKSIDRCRMLSIAYRKKNCIETSDIFNGFANALHEILRKGTAIRNAKGLNLTDTLAALDKITKNNAVIAQSENG